MLRKLFQKYLEEFNGNTNHMETLLIYGKLKKKKSPTKQRTRDSRDRTRRRSGKKNKSKNKNRKTVLST